MIARVDTSGQTYACIRTSSLSHKCHYFTALIPCYYIQWFKTFTQTAQCRSFKQDFNLVVYSQVPLTMHLARMLQTTMLDNIHIFRCGDVFVVSSLSWITRDSPSGNIYHLHVQFVIVMSAFQTLFPCIQLFCCKSVFVIDLCLISVSFQNICTVGWFLVTGRTAGTDCDMLSGILTLHTQHQVGTLALSVFATYTDCGCIYFIQRSRL